MTVTEFTSDNFSVNGTGLGGNDLDFPVNITPNVAVIDATGQDGIYWNLRELRALADFVLELAPDDVPVSQLAEVHYYRGMAYLMQSENFVAMSTVADEMPIAAAALLDRAINDLNEARSLDAGSDVAVWAAAALARAYRVQGNAG